MELAEALVPLAITLTRLVRDAYNVSRLVWFAPPEPIAVAASFLQSLVIIPAFPIVAEDITALVSPRASTVLLTTVFTVLKPPAAHVSKDTILFIKMVY
jgi:hypothetical protein